MKKFFGTLAVSAALLGSAHANPFTDVPSGHWAYNAINHVVQSGIMKGYRGGMFKGKETVTRYEMAIIISRLVKKAHDGHGGAGTAVSSDVRRTMDRLGEEFMDELDLIGARLTALENAFHEHVVDGGEAGSSDGVNISGDIRFRTEFWNMDTSPTTDVSDDVTLHRTRLNFEKSIGDADIFAQLQHSGSFGDRAGTMADMGMSIHQVYSTIHFGDEGNTRDLQIGRFGMAYGDETLIGTVGWSNVGRTFDGFRYTAKEQGDSFGYDFFYTNVTDDDPTGMLAGAAANDDQFMGFNLSWDDVLKGEANVFWYDNGRDATVAAGDNVSTVGFNWSRSNDDSHYYFQYAQQSGDTGTAAGLPEYDGSMMRMTGTYDYDDDKTVSLDYQSYSGDDAGTDMSNWQRLYDTGHAILGFADVYTQAGVGTSGIDDLSLNFAYDYSDISAFGLAYHMFSANEVAGAGIDDDLGTELDLTWAYKYSDDVNFKFGYSAFSAGALATDATPGISAMDRTFGWVTTNVKF